LIKVYIEKISCSWSICYPFKQGYRLVYTFCFLLVYSVDSTLFWLLLFLTCQGN